MLLHLFANMPRLSNVQRAHWEVGRELAGRLGLGPSVQTLFDQIYERWDGRGNPGGQRGDAIALPVRIVHVAHSAETFARYAGPDGCLTLLRDRAAGALDPYLVERFSACSGTVLPVLDAPSAWTAVMDAEPGGPAWLADERLDDALRAAADFADLKSPETLGHSRGVAQLAADAALACGLPEDDAAYVRRAGWLHDVGRVGVSAAVWQKTSALSAPDWEAVRLHPYYTERVTARAAGLDHLGALAALHHERVDGSGYHRGLGGIGLSPLARILAAADAYHALREPRPHRAAQDAGAAGSLVKQEVRAGRLDARAADAVLSAAGGRSVRSRRPAQPAGLTDREADVLRFLARGHSPRAIAAALSITPKTARNHVQNIYEKLGVSTRAAATLFAVQHGLVDQE